MDKKVRLNITICIHAQQTRWGNTCGRLIGTTHEFDFGKTAALTIGRAPRCESPSARERVIQSRALAQISRMGPANSSNGPSLWSQRQLRAAVTKREASARWATRRVAHFSSLVYFPTAAAAAVAATATSVACARLWHIFSLAASLCARPKSVTARRLGALPRLTSHSTCVGGADSSDPRPGALRQRRQPADEEMSELV